MSHEDYKEMIPARALSALDAAEDRALTEHLISCVECRIELESWRETCATIALGAEPAEPPAALRERILDQVRVQPSAVRPKVVPFATPTKVAWSSFGKLGAIAASVLFLALVAYAVVVWRENRANQSEMVRLRSELEKVQQDLKQKSDLLVLISSAGSQMAELAPTAMAPGATAKIAYDKTGHAMLMAQGLPAAPAGRQYQLWFIVGDKKMPGKAFSADQGGSGMIVDQVPAAAMNSAVFAITDEPMGGVQTPTGQIYLVSRS
jgi:Anti-sigma-K factor rskA, C-terminal